jgi:hypothetical protein
MYIFCGHAINDLERVRITHSGATHPAYLNSISTFDFLTVHSAGGSKQEKHRACLPPPDHGSISARKVIKFGYEDSGYNMVMKGLCHSATEELCTTSL